MPFFQPDSEIGIIIRPGFQGKIETVVNEYFTDYCQTDSLAFFFGAEKRREYIFLNLIGYSFAVIPDQ